MLQRQIIFKQLQELQRKHQLQELGNARNQHYSNQLSSLKQASGGQIPSAVNGMPVHNSSLMLVAGKVQMMPGMHNEPEIVPTPNHSMIQEASPHLQFDVSLYGASTPNIDNNLDPYSHRQRPPDHSTNLSTKNNNDALEIPSMQPSHLNKQSSLNSDQLSMPDESLLTNQVHVQGLSGGISCGYYSHQGMTAQRSALPPEPEARQENECWQELTLRKVLKPAPSDPDAPLDPLEQKFLYSTEDTIWGSSFSKSIDIGLGTFESEDTSHVDRFPTIRSGSWSALMQSAVAEISSGDGGLQEEWSGLNFQNPELLTDNQTSNYIDNVKQKSNWVDTDLQNSSPSVKTEIVPHNSDINGSSPGFQRSDRQYLREKEGFHSESSHVSNQHSPRNTSQYNCQQKDPTGCSQLFQCSSFPNIWLGQRKEHSKNDVFHLSNNNQPGLNISDHEMRDIIWLHGSTPHDIQKPFDQVGHKMVDQLNIHSYSVESEKISPGKNNEHVLRSASSDLYCQSMISQASNTMLDLLNKDTTSINHAPGMQFSEKVSAHNESPQTETSVASCAKLCNNSPISLDLLIPQSYSLVPSLAMGNSCSTYPPGHDVNNHFENQVDQHSPASPKPIDVATNDLVYNSDNSMLKNVKFVSSELPVLRNEQVTQAAVTSVSLQHAGYLTGVASQWVDMTTQPCALSTKPQKSPNFFCSLNSESSSLETSLVLPNEQSSINPFRQEYNVQGFCASSGKPEYHEQQLGAESFLQKGSTEIINSISVSRYTHDQDLCRENHVEANAVASSSLMTQSHQPSNKLVQIDTESPSCTARDLKSLALNQTKAILHQVGSSDNTVVTNSKDMFLHGQKEGVNSEAKGYSDVVSHFGVFHSLDNKGWDLQEAWRAQSDKGYSPNIQNMQMLGQNDNQNCYNDSNDAFNTTYQSQISLQLAQFVSKHDGTLKNGQLFRPYDPKAAGTTVKRFSDVTIESSVLPSIAATLIESEQSSPNKLPSYVTCQNMAVSLPKKRKVAFDMVPWHKEVKRDSVMLQNIRVAELEWDEASNRRPEEVKNEAEILEDMQPRFRAKRRLIFATQLMQQVFKPAPAVILSSDAGSNCESVTYFAARFSFADACLVTSNSQMTSDGNGMSSDKLNTYKRCYASDFAEVVEGLVDKVKRLEGELLRMDKSFSIVDIKVESQELEKFSTINRFAKFHIKAQPTGAALAASNGTSTISKTYPQRYVSARPMPKTVPEGTGCQSL
ncbi:uncharacterized protein [Henckelia pumila]|uniref:uncharacterized protein n=1 Tax=Henckelia pumila TaxID=405737 RepID=UPI003C6E6677